VMTGCGAVGIQSRPKVPGTGAGSAAGTYQELSSRPGPFQHMDALQKAL
jgi:hypothetical protein